MIEKITLPVLFGFAIFLSSFSLISSNIQGQSTEAGITAFSFTEQTGLAIITPNIFDIGLTKINTSSFLELVGGSGGTHYGNQIGLNPSFDPMDVNNLEIRFGQGTQKVHRFTIPAGSGPGVAVADYTYQDYIDVPFQVWDVDNNKQLMVSFRDQKDDGNFNLIEFYTSAGDEANHSREYIFIHNIDYDATNANSNIALAGGHQFDWIYSIWPHLTSGGSFDPNALPVSTLAIEVANLSVDAEVIYGTNLTALVPTITTDPNATVSPISGLANDFTDPRIYKVTAEDGITFEKYLVDVSFGANPATAIDSLALLELYSSTVGANWSDPWNLELPMNNWSGISFADGRVTRLDLASRNLNGIIPSMLSDLTKLNWLDLSNNNLFGVIPKDLGSLINLKSLFLNGNKLTGSIPVELGDLTALVNLWVVGNQLGGEIPTELGNLTNLLYLNAGHNNFTGSIPPSLGNTNMNFMYLSNCNLTGIIPPELGNLSNLQDLRLEENNLSGRIPDELNTLVDLRLLILNDNANLNGSVPLSLTALTLETFTFQNTNLCELSDASYDTWKSGITNYQSSGLTCDLTAADITAFSFPEEVSMAVIDQDNSTITCEVITGIDLTTLISTFTPSSGATAEVTSTTQISGTTANDFTNTVTYNILAEDGSSSKDWAVTVTTKAKVPDPNFRAILSSKYGITFDEENNITNLATAAAITTLNVANQNISSLTGIQLFTGLTQLDASQNNLTRIDVTANTELLELTLFTNQLSEIELSSNSKLWFLDVGENQLTALDITENIDLSWLSFSTNQISTIDLSKNTDLEILSTSNNPLNDLNISFNTALTQIVASNNNLTNINLSTNTALLDLDIPYNNLFEIDISNNTALTKLSVYKNQLSSLDVSANTELTHLLAYENQLSGSLPVELVNLTNLSVLNLSGNQLTGTIPSQLGSLDNLTDLSLHANALTGEIPVEVGNLSNLIYLSLYRNQLEGIIPKELGNLNNLLILQIDDNRFTGSIPSTLGDLNNLIILALQNNNLTGVIPQELGNLINVKSLFLANNQLTGPIIAEIWNLRKLEGLGLDYNDFSGTIPEEVANLSSLTQLNLHNNPNLSGSLPNRITELALNDITFAGTMICEPTNATYQSWKATVLNYQASGIACDITSTDIEAFSILGQIATPIIDPTNHTVIVTVPFSTDLTTLISTFTLSSGATAEVDATMQESGITVNDFTSSVVYSILAENDLNIQDWTIAVILAEPINETDILGFSMAGQTGEASINAANHMIDLEVFYGTSLTSIIPTLTLSNGASIAPENQVAQDFTNPVMYTVTAEDGITTEAWTITVSVASIDNGLLAWYPFNDNANDESGKGNDGTINGATLTLDRFGNANSAYSFDSPNTISTPLDLEADQPFSFSVWVKWNGNSSSFQTILSWWIPGGRVYIDVDPNGQLRFGDDFGTTGIDLPPAEWVQVSGTDDAQGFIKLFVNGILVAEENTDSNYDPGPMVIGGKMNESSVNETFSGDIDDIRIYDRVLQAVEILGIFNQKNTKANILSFDLQEQSGLASLDATNQTIDLAVIYGTNLTSLIPTLTLSEGASIDPEDQVAQDFTNPVTYTVTAEDGTTTQDWIITVTVAPNTETDILSFSLTEQMGGAAIDAVNHTIDVELVPETILTSLIPTITISDNASVSPGNQIIQDFTSPVTYTVTAQDLITTQDWIVTVIVAPTVLGIENEIKNISLYPNPVENQLFLDHEGLNNEPLNITVSDLTGKYIEVIQVVGKNNFMLNVEYYKPGVYLLLIQQGNSKSTLRFIKN